MRIAYLINQYPIVSHSFIRREIIAVEEEGFEVERVTIRSTASDLLVDPADLSEQAKTHSILGHGSGALIRAALVTLFSRPVSFLRGAKLAWRCGRRSDRGMIVHAVYLVEACAMLQLVRRFGCRHIHTHHGTNATLVAMLVREMGGPTYSFMVHGNEEFDSPRSLSLEEKINRSSAVVAITNYCQAQLYRWCGFEQWSKIQLVRCGLDSSFLTGEPVRMNDAPKLVFVGRLCEQKGPMFLIEAAGELARRATEFELIIVGDGDFRQAMERRIAELGLEDKVRLVGWATNDEVRRYIETSRALVLPSFAEGLPAVIMEAMARGRPVISTYIAGMPELVEPGVSGWLVPAGAITPLTDAMEAAVTMPIAQLEEMGRAGRIRVCELHDVRKTARSLASIFRRCIEPLETQATCAALPAPSAELTP